MAGSSAVSYNRARMELGSKHPFWSGFIRYQPVFWRKLHLDALTSPPTIFRHVARLCDAQVPLEVNIDLNIDYSSFTGSYDSYVRTTHINNTLLSLSVLSYTAHLWQDLTISVQNGHFLDAVVSTLHGVAVPNLQSLQLTRVIRDISSDRLFRQFHASPLVFVGSAPALESLRVVSTSLPWAAPGYYEALRSIEIIHVPTLLCPSPSDFVSVITASPHLASICVVGSRSLFAPDPHLRRFTLPSLETLQLVLFGVRSSFLDILAYADMPSLRTLHISNVTSDDLCFVLNHCDWIAQITHLRLHSEETDPALVVSLLSRLERVVELDLTHTGAEFARALLSLPQYCPLLQDVKLWGDSVGLLYFYVRSRDTTSIQDLTFYHSMVYPLTFADTTYFRALHDLVPNFMPVPV
ncbi:hypothetical protein C8R44DRAFT_880836 [Mycena epipterygia]|nr:hypothetical protein C8R44DRAFT_880836 [Mycena epipterygia]